MDKGAYQATMRSIYDHGSLAYAVPNAPRAPGLLTDIKAALAEAKAGPARRGYVGCNFSPSAAETAMT